MQREQAKLVKEVLDPVGQKLRLDLDGLQKNAAAQAGNSNTVILAGEAIKLVMQVRLNSDRALVRHDEVFVKAAESAFADLKRVLASFEAQIVNPDVRKQFDAIKANADKFHDAFVKSMHDSKESFHAHAWRDAQGGAGDRRRGHGVQGGRDSRRAQDRT